MKLRPFSHTPGAKVLIPSTSHTVEAFPTLIRFGGKELTKEVVGPLKNFTICQDLERVCVTVSCEHYCIHILPNLEIIEAKRPHTPTYSHEVLDFGMHKKQEWEAIRKRGNFREIFPLWYRLGTLLNLPEVEIDQKGVFQLLAQIDLQHPETIIPTFTKIFLAGFSHFLIPQSEDHLHQGIVAREPSKTDPLYLLAYGAKVIRSLFLAEKEREVFLLPHLPPELFSGHFSNIVTSFGTFHLIWSKKQLRTVQFEADQTISLKIQFPKNLKRFRLNKKKIFNCGDEIEIQSNCSYLFDRFEK
ncbi:MAG: hypothetical protein S4CHLAM45_14530 [Chlamydiales bacterium]|nr:hypothetical protein [Chlamydiales bacterium]MCH9620585.1 hypothetical protein [Chlamydiales bacterium]MCH9623543.1 hypothetical protein [Chlamydiales bacterium]